MKNKRIGSSVKMEGKVKPVNVSPLIKCARYGFLILGYFYGSMRLSGLRLYEKKAGELRHKMLHEKKLKEKAMEKENTMREVEGIAKEFEITEFPPGWANDL